MASTSEVGNAKNIANLNLLNTNISALGVTYNPSNENLRLLNLQNLYTTAFTQQKRVNNLVAPYSLAVDERELIFKPLNRDLTKLRKAYKVTDGVTQAPLFFEVKSISLLHYLIKKCSDKYFYTS